MKIRVHSVVCSLFKSIRIFPLSSIQFQSFQWAWASGFHEQQVTCSDADMRQKMKE